MCVEYILLTRHHSPWYGGGSKVISWYLHIPCPAPCHGAHVEELYCVQDIVLCVQATQCKDTSISLHHDQCLVRGEEGPSLLPLAGLGTLPHSRQVHGQLLQQPGLQFFLLL